MAIGYDMDYTLIHYNVNVSVSPTEILLYFGKHFSFVTAAMFQSCNILICQFKYQAWEGRAYEYGMDNLRSMGYSVEGLSFDPDLVTTMIV